MPMQPPVPLLCRSMTLPSLWTPILCCACCVAISVLPCRPSQKFEHYHAAPAPASPEERPETHDELRSSLARTITTVPPIHRTRDRYRAEFQWSKIPHHRRANTSQLEIDSTPTEAVEKTRTSRPHDGAASSRTLDPRPDPGPQEERHDLGAVQKPDRCRAGAPKFRVRGDGGVGGGTGLGRGRARTGRGWGRRQRLCPSRGPGESAQRGAAGRAGAGAEPQQESGSRAAEEVEEEGEKIEEVEETAARLLV